MAKLSSVELLTRNHEVSGFDCGTHESLNIWLKKFALQNQGNDSARTYVLHRELVVVGYYAISAGSIAREAAPARISKGLGSQPIPVSLLGRLAVHKTEQGGGLGRGLLKDALLRIEQAADILGIRAVLVHSIDEAARGFYEQFDFEPCPGDDLHLMLLMKDLRQILKTT